MASQRRQSKSKSGRTLQQAIGYLLVVLGFIGFIAASTLTIEKIALLKDPTYQPTCSISPLLSCSPVMSSPQASAFGFPNPLIGIAGFAVVITSGMVVLAGAKLKRWYWLGLQAGVIFGISFVAWLMFQSIYRIGALCLYCMVVWSVMIPLFWYVSLYNIRQGNIVLKGRIKAMGDFAQRHHADILFVLYLIPIIAILNRFWYYWSSLI